jgi:hypothetical protein
VLAIVMSSATDPVEIIPGHRERCSGIQQKTFAFPPESLFAFNPESCSQSARNAVRDHPGIPFAFARNPHRVVDHVAAQIRRSPGADACCRNWQQGGQREKDLNSWRDAAESTSKDGPLINSSSASPAFFESRA